MPSQSSTRRVLSDVALTGLRCLFGITMMAHGFRKLSDMEGWRAQLVDLGVPAPQIASWAAVAGEFLGGAGLFFGFLTPIATLGVAGVTITAIARVHWGQGFFAGDGGMEYPLLLLALAVFFFVRGAGPFSLDAAVRHLYAKHGETEERHVESGRGVQQPPPMPQKSWRRG